ncbi:carboxymuconolactone decarboxylase family protein [Deminuibacter soli]|uniref:Carboxymuconolactone decarboxylase family protein n=1 Tax=Deminuibacter soli TaxID=2291815 RepID=A0A3E1NNV0_9BACT|nr:carboxymuconolactone decarboxylase family protein [Deminuibacter soli]RFM29468.1 carboxymuconolactone decarboxylase family protein [Deminuibacter soli]
MEPRFSMYKVQPEAYKALLAMEEYLKTTSLTETQKELIKIRASQINGCAFCIDMHTKDARKHGETEQRIYLLNAWREAPHYTEEERIMLAMTEEITLIHRHGLSAETYRKAIAAFGEVVTAQIIMAIININAWNRIGVALHMQPPMH